MSVALVRRSECVPKKLGGAFLAVTSGEVFYADMGHFGAVGSENEVQVRNEHLDAFSAAPESLGKFDAGERSANVSCELMDLSGILRAGHGL